MASEPLADGVGPELTLAAPDADITVIWDAGSSSLAPAPRKGCAMAVWGGKVVLMGGDGGRGVRFNDVHQLDLATTSWVELQCSEGPDGFFPSQISYHAMIVWRHYAVVFGGYDNSHTNEVRRLNLETLVWERCWTQGAVPERRYGHSLAVWRDQAIVMGGQGVESPLCDDLLFLDLVTMRWTAVDARGDRPPPSCYHTMSVWRNQAIVFGGSESPDVFVLDLELLFWTHVTPGGNAPSRRFGHAAAVWNDLCIFSCGRRDSTCNAEIFVLSLGTEAMYWVPFGIEASALGERHAHAMAVVGSKLVLFGGHGGTYYNDTLVLALDTMGWHSIAYTPMQRDGHAMFVWREKVFLWGGDGGGGRRFQDLSVLDFSRRTWRRCEQGGEIPSRRSYHATDVWGSMLVLFGGYDSTFTNDLHIMDLQTCEWLSVEQSGRIPPARYGHTLTVFGNHAYVFGGKSSTGRYCGPEVMRLDLHSLVWDVLDARGTTPANRYGHCAFLRNKQLYVFGGSGSKFYNDLHALDLEAAVWRAIDTTGVPPVLRSYHAVALWGEQLVVCGGDHGGGVRLNDIHVLDLRSMRWQHVRVRGTPPLVRCAHKLVVVRDTAVVFGGRDAGTYFNDTRYFNLDPSLDHVARLYCTVALVFENDLDSQMLASATETAPIAAFLSVVRGLPPELLMHVCMFSVERRPRRLPSDALLAEIRSQLTSPEQSRRWAVAAVVVAVAETVFGDLNAIGKSSYKAVLVRQLLARTRACVLRHVPRVALSMHAGRAALVALFTTRLKHCGDEWDNVPREDVDALITNAFGPGFSAAMMPASRALAAGSATGSAVAMEIGSAAGSATGSAVAMEIGC